MEFIDLGPAAGFTETRFGSEGFTVIPLARQVDHVVVLQVAPGGLIGRHPAVGRQVFAVVAGSGTVSGADGVEHPIGVGQAVVWEAGELHETRSLEGLTAVVSDGPDLQLQRLGLPAPG